MSAFDKVIGYEAIKEELLQVCDMIRNRAIYEALGAQKVQGILLYGEPGVGKSMMATAFLQESGLCTYTVRRNRPDGDFVKEIKNVFDAAAQHAPSVILLDDMDKFAADDNSSEELVAVQACMDEVKPLEVYVIATANDPNDIPDSLLRAGRFDRKILVECPTGADATAIVAYYMAGKRIAADVNSEDVAKMLSGKSCAELETVINEAAVYAAYERKDSIGMPHLVKATLRGAYGITDCRREITEEELEAIAYHEAGHAAMAEILREGSVGLLSVASERGSHCDGFMLRCEEFSRKIYYVLVSLGGKAAVELRFGKVASGTDRDLDRACEYIGDSITSIGTMGLGLLDMDRYRSETPFLLSAQEQVVHAEMERCLFKTKEILCRNRGFLDALAKALREKKTLLYSEVRAIRAAHNIQPAVVG